MRRTPNEMIFDILDTVQFDGRLTHLMYYTGINGTIIKIILTKLIEKELVSLKMNGKIKYYLITDKGRQLVVEYKKLKEQFEKLYKEVNG